MPPPEPRSSTVSPTCSSATAVGLPQPRLASTAVSGSSSRSRAAYSSAPNPGSSAVAAPQQLSSQPQSAGWPQPQPPWPLVTLVAAAAYRARTCSRRASLSACWVVIGGLLGGRQWRPGGRG